MEPSRLWPIWQGGTAFVAATGASLCEEDCRLAGETASRNFRSRVIAVNDAWRLCSFANLLYSGDWPWIEHHKGVPAFTGEKWTCLKSEDDGTAGGLDIAARYGFRSIASSSGAHIWRDPGFISQGRNSAFQAAQIAIHRGATRLVFLGLDCGGAHFFGEHPAAIRKKSDYAAFAAAFDAMARQLPALGVEAVNCSPKTALTCFPVKPLERVIDEWNL